MKTLIEFATLAALYLIALTLHAQPTVTGTTISWPNDGWYQVQNAQGTTTVCEGTRFCDVPPGDYIVINHTLQQRWERITVVDTTTDSPSSPDQSDPLSSGVIINDRTFSFPGDDWYEVQSASDYSTLCAGQRSCSVNDVSLVNLINHTAVQRWNYIRLPFQQSSSTRPPAQTGITIEGQTISWPDDGWYQVLNQQWESVCNGDRYCTVPPGIYSVINHTTNQRQDNIVIKNLTDTTPEPDNDNGNDTGIDTGTDSGDTSGEIAIKDGVISWPDNGWYQVQSAATYETLCEGGSFCAVPPGTYNVINLSTQQRWNNLTVAGDFQPATAPVFTEVPDQFVYAYDGYIEFPIEARSDSGAPILSAVSLPPNARFNTQTSSVLPRDEQHAVGAVEWLLLPEQFGEFTAIFMATDPNDVSLNTQITVRIVVSDTPNTQPNLPAPSDVQFVTVGETLDTTLYAYDDGQRLTLEVLSDHPQITSSSRRIPDSTEIAADTNTFAIDLIWSPTQSQIGEHKVRIRVTDGQLTSVERTLTIIVTADCNSQSTTETLALDCLTENDGQIIANTTASETFYQSDMVGVGDFNGDGIDDFVISAVSALDSDANEFGSTANTLEPARYQYGHIVFGSATSLPTTLSPDRLHSMQGVSVFGDSTPTSQTVMLPAGDFNRDGFDDIAMNMADRLVILYGSASASGVIHLSGTSESGTGESGQYEVPQHHNAEHTSVLVPTPFAQHDTQIVVKPAGDVDGDGFSDLLLDSVSGSQFSSDLMFLDVAVVLYGSNSLPRRFSLFDVDTRRRTVLTETAVFNTIDIDTFSVGDVNGDTLSDIVMADATQLAIIFGNRNRAERITLDSTVNSRDFSLLNTQQYRAGAGGGDFNGDGIADIVLARQGNPASDNEFADVIDVIAGRRNFPSRGTTDQLSVTKLILNDYPARPSNPVVSLDADFNGDGYADVIATYPIAALNSIGGHAVQLLYGNSGTGNGNGTQHQTEIGAQQGLSLTANPANHIITRPTGTLGDINADGFADIGLPLDNYFSNTVDEYAVILGR